ncbi:hypothetical protein [Thermococcus aciditolerans]|uniref:Uncharacterized protein n=1 Tax=Thermococcus aciditolerans TaxID=2598455 RepID=A0A5C0SLU6_9EURY|nr:hypothetical protein [Thermococcus aciditolerans]QEK14962.1 hypothetical protein FPV09_07515 [Thermococcus aciditolerans]
MMKVVYLDTYRNEVRHSPYVEDYMAKMAIKVNELYKYNEDGGPCNELYYSVFRPFVESLSVLAEFQENDVSMALKRMLPKIFKNLNFLPGTTCVPVDFWEISWICFFDENEPSSMAAYNTVYRLITLVKTFNKTGWIERSDFHKWLDFLIRLHKLSFPTLGPQFYQGEPVSASLAAQVCESGSPFGVHRYIRLLAQCDSDSEGDMCVQIMSEKMEEQTAKRYSRVEKLTSDEWRLFEAFLDALGLRSIRNDKKGCKLYLLPSGKVGELVDRALNSLLNILSVSRVHDRAIDFDSVFYYGLKEFLEAYTSLWSIALVGNTF